MREAVTTVIEADGGWHVADGNGVAIAGPFKTNADAWRWIDRQSGEAVSRSESVSSWIMSRIGVDDRTGMVPRLKRQSVRDRLRKRRRMWSERR